VLGHFDTIGFINQGRSAIYDQCSACERIPPPGLSTIQAVLLQFNQWLYNWLLSFCIAIQQRNTVPIVSVYFVLLHGVLHPIIGYSALSQTLGLARVFTPSLTWFSICFVFWTLQYIGNKRARLMYRLNSVEVEMCTQSYARMKRKPRRFGNQTQTLFPDQDSRIATMQDTPWLSLCRIKILRQHRI